MTFSLRPEAPGDESFLRGLVTATVAEELGAANWPEPMPSTDPPCVRAIVVQTTR